MHTISVIGGTGELGSGLAQRWAKAGIPVIIGSRDLNKAEIASAELNAKVKNNITQGMTNFNAASKSDIVVLTVKFEHQASTLDELNSALHGKILVDTTVPLMPPKVARVQLPSEGSAAVISQNSVDKSTQVVSAFQNVSAAALKNDVVSECDVLVTGDNPEAREIVVKLAEEAGFTAWHAGPLENSAAAEALTSLLIFMNKRYKNNHAGLKITGISKP
ncbi:MAG: NADPH-dependent F420 reductase [Pseudomonadota bacterium]|nr:NADPH-dependent F420 reductase [Pseudomonadota bacterium]